MYVKNRFSGVEVPVPRHMLAATKGRGELLTVDMNFSELRATLQVVGQESFERGVVIFTLFQAVPQPPAKRCKKAPLALENGQAGPLAAAAS